ncbi:bifunctional methylenetetrahydrofolate dehydrogenase/methenyltetrahydrofolate cyclohydrolase FolD [Pseudomonas defluvii]|jgi:methylenetetrahydrofolate dehydrogenase (NADP+)/methenyltetrahydrofolate cyclohydrolase|uniref:bifunctional methylenetetrahydrofolate dehydrogenase/methenyltetrahydrofolate cyclohydrolase FolD n=1 Tax=unclassified Pseudomonas TaxID=196821 RepID=UPI000C193A1F|nr:bifunctional methylenetetrahydrofolate dehydrogenase/methenyltetrahydrofolate cyclohydrolase FolD [Pseudomonas sp. HLS-6]ATR83726.1 bifunctional methylenetetrahydrofolate dehydrogenase/methenyltetrahydrofolate cyclohydrolase FolD [Pseudomonas sp. HLS-6]MEE3636712.1 bifunctional methylenetetrahydrofolate dehydrogenase/methenyltetrahydrofolate cyclohydrolase FolD [Pseudomonas sp. AL 58]WJM95757.1 bifunctional methylenetetrahydrofolate dehydrogenase/methenyltetrahydrofolate cyclohydrolase FolD [
MSPLKLIDGKAAAAQVLQQVREDVRTLKADGIEPALAVILVGEDPASQVYVRNKILRAEEAGIRSLEYRLPATTGETELLALIGKLNDDPQVHGLLLQLPLPPHIEETRALQAIAPSKDVDGFHSENVGGLSQGRDVLTPCTPSGCLYLLEQVLGDLSGKHAVVIGRSNIVGKPMAALLLKAHCSVTVVHSRSADAKALCQLADIVIAAVGRPRLIDGSWLKEGAVVIDVGINRIDDNGRSRLVGDVDFDSALPKVAAITPVPGGVGPMTIAFLMKNTVIAARQQAQRSQSEAVCLSTY